MRSDRFDLTHPQPPPRKTDLIDIDEHKQFTKICICLLIAHNIILMILAETSAIHLSNE